MVIERGDVWWADLGEPGGSEPGDRRPILVVQSDSFNRSRLRTVVAVVLTSNVRLIDAPGNVLLPAKSTRLDRDSLDERSGRIHGSLLKDVENGLRLVLDL